MDHQPFEEWIFSQKEITIEENKKLNNHLNECEVCKDLQESWSQVESILVQAPMSAPASGFAQRFATRMETKKVLIQQKQSIKYLLVVGLVLLIITLLLFALLFFTFSTGEMIVGAVTAITSFFHAFINLRAMAYQFFHNASPLAIVFGWLLIAIWGVVLMPLWAFTVWKVSKQGVLQK
jgi:hypothetical protein